MSTLIAGTQTRNLVLGNGPVTGKLVTLAGAATHQVFTVTGGELLFTALWGKCTTEMAAANTVQLQFDPSGTGDTVAFTQAVDLGTTNTAAGTLIMVHYDMDGATDTPLLVKGAGKVIRDMAVPAGDVECVITGAGADGAITWYATWVPLTTGAYLTAAA